MRWTVLNQVEVFKVQGSLLFLIGLFVVLAIITVLSIILISRKSAKKLLKGVPSEDFRRLNYEYLFMKTR